MDRYVTHASFTLERSYPVPPARVFAAWADPALKSRWFAGGDACPNHELDFRVGGREVATGGPEGGPVMTFESLYREIVPHERIVYTSTMSAGADVITVSLTTVEFKPVEGKPVEGKPVEGKSAAGGTQLVLTEQGAFLDGKEEPAWRENGTADQLKALATLLESTGLEGNDD
jgi:uncharacterized protein YndB with AHSA1/START domain